MHDFLSRDFEVNAIELPGRGNRMQEALLSDFDAAAEDLLAQIVRQLSSMEFILYGHSMGASLALRITSLLEKMNRPPVCLIVSGNAGPGVRDPLKRHLMNKHELIGELKKLGGTADELFEQEELFALYEPILRADFRVTEINNLSEEPPVNVPVSALMGDTEDCVDRIMNWERFTTSKQFDYRIFPGDHFFIYKYPAEIAHLIKTKYTRLSSLKYS
jgi:surfactin synthase thioesterase subunit